jgi:predicted nucleic acid-binding protein
MSRELVIDGSVSGAWALQDEATPESRELLQLVVTRKLMMVVPELWWYEVLNALRSAVARRRIDEQDSRLALAVLGDVPMELVPVGALGQATILSKAIRLNLSVYDAAYLHLAESRGVRLVSEDQGILKLQRRYPWIRTIREVLADERIQNGQ